MKPIRIVIAVMVVFVAGGCKPPVDSRTQLAPITMGKPAATAVVAASTAAPQLLVTIVAQNAPEPQSAVPVMATAVVPNGEASPDLSGYQPDPLPEVSAYQLQHPAIGGNATEHSDGYWSLSIPDGGGTITEMVYDPNGLIKAFWGANPDYAVERTVSVTGRVANGFLEVCTAGPFMGVGTTIGTPCN